MSDIDIKLIDTNNNDKNDAFLAVDIGTTNLKCSLYNKDLKIFSSQSTKVTKFIYYFFLLYFVLTFFKA